MVYKCYENNSLKLKSANEEIVVCGVIFTNTEAMLRQSHNASRDCSPSRGPQGQPAASASAFFEPIADFN